MATDDDSDGIQIEWHSPWSYPTRVTNELSIQIATDIAQGADLTAACMRAGVAPSRAKKWLRWGEEAYARDANPHDRQEAYLNFFLKVMQAVGIAAVPAQHAVYHYKPEWWLSHHPEIRGGWGGDSEQAVLPTDDTETTVVEALPAGPEKPSTEKMRTILRMLVESGIAVYQESPSDDDAGDGPTDTAKDVGSGAG